MSVNKFGPGEKWAPMAHRLNSHVEPENRKAGTSTTLLVLFCNAVTAIGIIVLIMELIK